ncbi:MAG: hypothetical protein WDO68_09810 [Gammaproteobacteria bacterium]
MDMIERFTELCTDGRPVSDPSRFPTAAGAVATRWKSSTIVRLQWECGGKGIEIEHLYGLMAQVLPDRRSVAVLRSPPHGRFATALEFIDAQGTLIFTLASPISIEGQSVAGEFAWFESATERTPAVVRVVFWALGDDRYYLLDVSSATGAISAVMPLQ